VVVALIELFRRPTPDQVVRQHSADVLRLLRRIFGPHADVDDVFQAAFVEVIRSLPAFKGEAKLKTWIHRIVLNVAYQEMRMTYREREVRSNDDVETLVIDDPDGERNFERAEQRKMIYEGLRELSPKKRLAVILHDIEGCTLKEISETTGRPLQTVASQVRAGRAELADWFARRASMETQRPAHAKKVVGS
jgi:RNA polymerase sigma-70 factor (ECF subfamily)